MSAECQLETIRRINFLRAELECTLRISDTNNSPPLIKSDGKRPLNLLFRSGEAAQIQISGPPVCASDLRALRQGNSRFTVSPTPNAPSPAMNDETTKLTSPLRVFITKEGREESRSIAVEKPSIFVPPPGHAIASSPASSIDSGVASPGANDFLFGPSSPTTFPSWATIPRTLRHVFNFSQTGSLIDALALPEKQQSKMTDQPSEGGKKSPPCGSTPSTNTPSQPNRMKYGYNIPSTTTISSPSDASSSPSSSLNQPAAPQMKRQLSEGSSSTSDWHGSGGGDVITGLPPRAATMPPLKSILKKPRPSNNGGDHQLQQNCEFPRNHQRRMPTRIVLFRSISEGLQVGSPHSPIDSAANFNAAIIGKLSSLDEHQEKEEEAKIAEVHAEDAATPTIDGEDFTQAAPIVKKRVSFSEHVQARIYRSNSSIFGQRRKNEKKAKQRANRRCNSDEADHEDKGFADEIHGGRTNNNDKQTAPSSPICRPRESASAIFSSHPAVNNSGFSVLAQ